MVTGSDEQSQEFQLEQPDKFHFRGGMARRDDQALPY